MTMEVFKFKIGVIVAITIIEWAFLYTFLTEKRGMVKNRYLIYIWLVPVIGLPLVIMFKVSQEFCETVYESIKELSRIEKESKQRAKDREEKIEKYQKYMKENGE